MVFKNSCKLFFANFSTMWKLLVYFIICIGIVACLFLPVMNPVDNAVEASGIADEVTGVLSSYNISANIFELFSKVYVILMLIFDVITSLFVTNPFEVIYVFFLVFWLLPFLFDLAEIPTGEMIYGYMSSCTKYGFTSTYIKRLGTSAFVGLFKSTFKAVINVSILIIVFYVIKITELGGILYYLTPIVLVAVLTVLLSLKEMLFGGWMPSLVVLNCRSLDGFKKGVCTISRRFLKNFSTFVMLVLLILGVNYFFGTFAFVVTIPMSIFMIKVAEMVMFFTGQGMRYYVDLDMIITPQRFEESDNFKKVIDIL